ncbi:MAG: TIGR00730 family Rossman fold protein [Chlorobiales bacterium]|nr:TIGR00730 family Rossman fold protein [Chlorobiales bacterium]
MKSLCVFCGSSSGATSAYKETATLFGKALAKNGIRLVYGGGSVGLMGVVATAALQNGGEVIGVIPKFLADKELALPTVSNLHVVGSMHERKALMSDLSDGFVALPGGVGTLEELFEVFTWAQLGLHTKPCGVLNVDGYYNSLIEFLKHTVDQRFMKEQNFQMLLVDENSERLMEKMNAYQSPKIEKWLDRQSQT